jgi:hypothetical protein
VKFVASVLRPEFPEDAARVMARVENLALAEARMRLAAEPPALLALLHEDKAQALATELRDYGTAALALDAHVPSDRDRVRVHTIVLGDRDASFGPRFGAPLRVAWADVTLLLRGVREFRTDKEVTEMVQVPSLESAIRTDGKWVTTLEAKDTHSSDISRQQVILVYARNGRVALVADGDVDFSCLGTSKQPSSSANMAELARRMRERATAAYYDERLLRLGARPLPFVVDGEWSSHGRTMTVHRSDTKATFDVLAEVLHRAVIEGLLPVPTNEPASR